MHTNYTLYVRINPQWLSELRRWQISPQTPCISFSSAQNQTPKIIHDIFKVLFHYKVAVKHTLNPLTTFCVLRCASKSNVSFFLFFFSNSQCVDINSNHCITCANSHRLPCLSLDLYVIGSCLTMPSEQKINFQNNLQEQVYKKSCHLHCKRFHPFIHSWKTTTKPVAGH